MNPLASGAVWLVLTPVAFLFGLLPRAAELRLGPWLGRFFLAVDFKRRKIAADNIAHCFPDWSEARRAALLKENYEHYGTLVLELLHIFSPLPGHYRRYVEKNAVCDNFEVFERANALGRGTIVVTGHFANWEMMGIAGLWGVNCMVTGKRVKPEWLNRRLFNGRLSLNVRTASGKRILPEIIRWVKQGNNATVIVDQYAAPPSGVPVEFFGVTVDTQGVVGLLAQRTGAPVMMVFTHRDRAGVLRAVFEEAPLSEAELKDPIKATQALSDRVEAWLRKHPAQWLWVHRRFKNVVWPSRKTQVAA